MHVVALMAVVILAAIMLEGNRLLVLHHPCCIVTSIQSDLASTNRSAVLA